MSTFPEKFMQITNFSLKPWCIAKINKCRLFLKSLLERDNTGQQHFKQKEHFCENIFVTYFFSRKDVRGSLKKQLFCISFAETKFRQNKRRISLSGERMARFPCTFLSFKFLVWRADLVSRDVCQGSLHLFNSA